MTNTGKKPKKGKIIKFKQDSDTEYQRATDYLDDGNLWSALRACREAVRIDPGCIEYSLLLMEILCEAGLYEQALNTGLKVLSYDDTITEFYFHIASVLISMDETQSALSYLNTAIRLSNGEMDFFDEKDEISSLIQKVKSNGKFVLIDGESEHKSMLTWAEMLFEKNENAYAIQVLDFIPQTSRHFKTAQALKSVCLLNSGQLEVAKELSQEILQNDPDDFNARLNLLIIALGKGEKEQAKHLITLLNTAEKKSKTAHFRFCLTLLRNGLHKEGLDACAEYLEIDPFSKSMLLLEGLAYYNIGKTYDAKLNMTSILAIDDMDLTARFYNTYFQTHEKLTAPLEYTLGLPEAEQISILKTVDAALNKADDSFLDEWIQNADNACKVNWILQNAAASQLHSKITDKLLKKESVRVEDLLRENLVSTAVNALFKRELLLKLMMYAPSAPVAMTVGHELRLLDTKLPKAYKSSERFVQSAYLKTFVSLSLISAGFEKALSKLFNSASLLLVNIQPKKGDDDALAAAFACLIAKGLLLSNKRAIIEIFGAGIKRTDFFISLLSQSAGVLKPKN